jgi:phosphopantetheinyl transferase
LSLPDEVVAVALDDVDERWIPALGERERAAYAHLSIAKRRNDWLGGRVAAKRAAQRRTALPFPRLEIIAIGDGEERGRPVLFVDGIRDPGFVSISHAPGLALATYADRPIGLDLELIEHREDSFLEVAFDAEERARFLAIPDGRRDREITAAWCKKEAYLKLLGAGTRRPLPGLQVPGNLRVLQGSLHFSERDYAWAIVEGLR